MVTRRGIRELRERLTNEGFDRERAARYARGDGL
jgi:hypothetical protein